MEWCTFGRFCDAFLPLYRWGFCCTCPQGGYWHGTASLTFGVDIESIRWLGILQRIAVGYFVAALCEIWLPCQKWRAIDFYKSCYWQWCIAFSMSAMGLLYGVYVPDWQLRISDTTSSYLSSNDSNVYTVKGAVRGDIGPACNSAGMIDRYILGVHHLYTKPVYRNLKECNASKSEGDPGSSPSWRHAPFDPKVY